MFARKHHQNAIKPAALVGWCCLSSLFVHKIVFWNGQHIECHCHNKYHQSNQIAVWFSLIVSPIIFTFAHRSLFVHFVFFFFESAFNIICAWKLESLHLYKRKWFVRNSVDGIAFLTGDHHSSHTDNDDIIWSVKTTFFFSRVSFRFKFGIKRDVCLRFIISF